jgi:hypothetical protein
VFACHHNWLFCSFVMQGLQKQYGHSFCDWSCSITNPGFSSSVSVSILSVCVHLSCVFPPFSETKDQLWWHANTEEPHLRNSGLRKEHYKRFWTMLLHRGVWNDDRYIVMKVDAMSRDPRRQRYDNHKSRIFIFCFSLHTFCLCTLVLCVPTIFRNKRFSLNINIPVVMSK